LGQPLAETIPQPLISLSFLILASPRSDGCRSSRAICSRSRVARRAASAFCLDHCRELPLICLAIERWDSRVDAVIPPEHDQLQWLEIEGKDEGLLWLEPGIRHHPEFYAARDQRTSVSASRVCLR
jgi:hypothetical protein